MAYLLTQMFLYLLVAFLLGLLLGWLIWRYGKPTNADVETMQADRDALLAERKDLRTNLDACRERSQRDRESLEAMRAERDNLETKLDAERNRVEAASLAMPAAAVAPAAPAVAVEATKPEGLSAPRGGVADDLKEISGVGPKMEDLLHTLGYFHFDQIADWSASDVAWVDENLEGFKGRVSRDNWVSQARKLAKR